MIFLKFIALLIVGSVYGFCIGNLNFYADAGKKRLAWLWGVAAAVQVGIVVLLVTL